MFLASLFVLVCSSGGGACNIRKIDLTSQTVTTFAGSTSGACDNTDGTGTGAQFGDYSYGAYIFFKGAGVNIVEAR